MKAFVPPIADIKKFDLEDILTTSEITTPSTSEEEPTDSSWEYGFLDADCV